MGCQDVFEKNNIINQTLILVQLPICEVVCGEMQINRKLCRRGRTIQRGNLHASEI